jgi:hypothetical protein
MKRPRDKPTDLETIEEQAERKRKEFEEVERSRLMATRTKVEMERDRY